MLSSNETLEIPMEEFFLLQDERLIWVTMLVSLGCVCVEQREYYT